MKFYDLFCGIGGFRIGMEKNGHECVGSCEIDEQARQVYTKNFGCEPEQRDATKLNPKELPDFDCLCAGFPCQSFSIAGKHGGFEDTRGTLFFEIIRIARERKPSILFLENVKGLLSHNKGQTFETILKALDELGYWYEWQLLTARITGFRRIGKECILSDILQEQVPEKYYLSEEALETYKKKMKEGKIPYTL